MNRIQTILTLLLLAIVFAGCGPQDDRVRIRIWHQKTGAERTLFEQVIREYNAANPDRLVEILYRETEELRNLFVIASVGGQGPEVVFGPADNISIFEMTHSIMPLDHVLRPEFKADFIDDGLIRIDNQTWMIADQVGNHLMFVYNKALMPVPPRTTDEMVEMLRELTMDTTGDGRIDQYGLTWNYSEPFFFIPFLNGFGGRVMDEEGNPTLDNEATIQAIQFILDLRDKYRVIPRESNYDVAETLFKEGRSAAIINGPWAWAGYSAAGIDYGLANIPINATTGLPSAPYVSAKGYSVNINTDEGKLPYIAHLLEYLTGPEMQTRMARELATIPVIRAVRELEEVKQNEILGASLMQAEAGTPMPLQPQMRQVWDGTRGAYQLVMNGSVTPEQGARLMQREVEKRIRDTFL
jgi:maltose-binding protein MalE